ncbi:SH3 domain-containing protein [Lacticaseibacillus sp. GG6-2]
MKISKLTASLLTSTAVFAGVLVAQGQSKNVSASSKLRVDYSSNLRQKAGTDAKIIGGLSVGSSYTYDKTEQASGYTWYEIGDNQWVANAGATAVSGQVKVNYAANKRVGPSTGHKIVGSFYPGQVLTFTETQKANGYTWYKVGTNAWIASAGASEYTNGQTTVATTTAAPAAQATTTAATQATTAQAPVAAKTATPAATASTQASQPVSQATTTTASVATTKAPATQAATTTAAPAAQATTTAASGRVKTNVASNLRSGAGTSYGVAGTLPAGSVRSYTATATANGYTWYKVGANAWVAGATPYYGNAATTTTTPAKTTTASQSNASANYSSPATSNASNTTSQATTTTATSNGSKTSSDAAGNAYAWGQCTWYVKSVAPWAGNHWGNGGQWGSSAAAEGFTVNRTPSVGSIVVVAGGQNFGGWTAAPGYGHVAYVVGVSGNTITVQQGGTGFSNPGGPNTQTVSGASNFTYIHR